MDIQVWIEEEDHDEIENFINKYLNGNHELFFKFIIDEGIIDTENLDEHMASLFPDAYLSYWMNKKPEQVEKDAQRDLWLTADEALEYGIIDEIIGKSSKK